MILRMLEFGCASYSGKSLKIGSSIDKAGLSAAVAGAAAGLSVVGATVLPVPAARAASTSRFTIRPRGPEPESAFKSKPS